MQDIPARRWMSVTLRSVGRWKRDEEVSSCESCRRQFGLLVRKHHCRSCGGIFCKACTEKTVLIDVVDKEKPQRVCETCYGRLMHPPPASPLRPQNAQQPIKGTADAATPATAKDDAHPDMDTLAPTMGENRVNRETESPPKSSRSSDESDDEFDRPMDMASRLSALVSSHCIPSTQNFSFLSVLQDSLKNGDAENVLNILIFASTERQQAMVVTVEPHETMGDLAARLAEMYFKLENPPFRKMTVDAMDSLKERLRFSSEYQLIDPKTEATTIATQCRNIVLSAFSPDSIARMSKTNAASERSLKEFWRSERSEQAEEQTAAGDW